MTALSEPGLCAYFLRHRVFFHYKRRAGDCQAKVWKIHKTAPITPIKSINSPFRARSTRSFFCKNMHISAYREPRRTAAAGPALGLEIGRTLPASFPCMTNPPQSFGLAGDCGVRSIRRRVYLAAFALR